MVKRAIKHNYYFNLFISNGHTRLTNTSGLAKTKDLS